MDSHSSKDDAQPNEPVSALINEFFDRRQAGERLSVEQFAAEHPEASEDLRPYLDGLGLIEQARSRVGDLAQAAPAAADLPLIPGYELIGEIGRGGMGVVYRALQLSTKREVALKVILAGPFASHAAQRRFEREVELTARIQHPGIVRVLEGGAVAGQRYYAMDFVSGERLDARLAATDTTVRSTLELFLQICDAIQDAHDHGVVHRDLKPSNILIDDQDHPHVLDFGLAKTTDQAESEDPEATLLSLPGQVVGTLHYLSPEQAAAGATDAPAEIDARVDVYALGVMLYETLTGSAPYDTSGRPSQVIQNILETPPARPSSFSKNVDGELETILLKALEKERERRYASVRELADDLRRYLAGDPILARPPSSLYIIRKKLTKHRVPVVFGVAVLALGLIALGVGMWTRHTAWEKARRTVLGYQRVIDDYGGALSAGSVKALYEQHRRMPEACLVWAQTQYYGDSQDGAIRFLESQLRKDSDRWDCAELLADIYRGSGDNDRAESLVSQAERGFPGTAEDWYVRSFATFDLERALQYAAQAVSRAPGHVLARRRLTNLQLRTEALDDAWSGIDKLIEMGENPREWDFKKAHILARRGRYRQAIDLLTREIEQHPDSSRAYRVRAHVYRRVKKYELAAADYSTAMELDGKATVNMWDYYQRATPLWILGRAEEALDDYRLLRIRLGRPFYSDARSYLILRQLERDDEAEQLLAAARRDVRDDWLAQVFRTLAGELDGVELVAAAVDRDDREKLCEAYYYAGEAALLENHIDKARQWFERCLQTGVKFDLETFPLTPMNETELADWRLETLAGDELEDGDVTP